MGLPVAGHFYPRSPCGERLPEASSRAEQQEISIHALLAESDNGALLASASNSDFYPRSPCGERPIMDNIIFVPRKFLSTLSLRRATLLRVWLICLPRDFYPRSPCGERRDQGASNRAEQQISIHALLAESDQGKTKTNEDRYKFLSTLSLRRATSPPSVTPAASRNFYPRSPCGERHSSNKNLTQVHHFYPRSPCGERLDYYAIRR